MQGHNAKEPIGTPDRLLAFKGQQFTCQANFRKADRPPGGKKPRNISGGGAVENSLNAVPSRAASKAPSTHQAGREQDYQTR